MTIPHPKSALLCSDSLLAIAANDCFPPTWHITRTNLIPAEARDPPPTPYTRKLRNDAATLYTEIHSHPLPATDLLSNKKAHGSEIREWINHALADFTDRMPDDIDWSAVMHLDEGFVHFHIIAINTHDPKLDANKHFRQIWSI